MATIAQTGLMRPVTARGTPMPLKVKANIKFWTVLLVAVLADFESVEDGR